MKPANLGLIIASLAFGASTIYLAIQLREEHARAEQVTAESQALRSRIADLERAREQFSEVRQVGGGAVTAADAASPAPYASPAIGRELVAPALADADVPAPRAGFPPPDRTEAFQKMMRSQLRANNKR